MSAIQDIKRYCKKNPELVAIVTVEGLVLASYCVGLYIGAKLTTPVDVGIMKDPTSDVVKIGVRSLGGKITEFPFDPSPKAVEVTKAFFASMPEVVAGVVEAVAE